MQLRFVLLLGTRVSEPIIKGEVSVPGLDVEVVTEINGRPIRTFADLDEAVDDSDVHSLGSGTLVQYNDSGIREPRRYLPVFYARGPKLRNVLVREGGPIKDLSDLRGRRIGVTSYTNTASIWIRGLLQHEYGIGPDENMWVEGESDFVPAKGANIPRESIVQQTGKRDRLALVGMLKRGEIDALCWPGGGGYYAFYPGGPLDRFCGEQGGIQSLVSDPTAIIDYYRRAQLDHLTETVAIKESVIEKEPEAPAMVLELFRRSAELVRQRMAPEDRELQTKEMRIIERDPFDFKFGPVEMNSVATLSQYNAEQDITGRVIPVDDLIAPSLR